jgi:putative two-component system response regulator
VKEVTILVADCDEENRQNVSNMIVALGRRPVTAVDGPSALRLLRERPTPDAAFLSVDLPGISGANILETIRKDRFLNEIPVIMMASQQDERLVASCIETGADDYLIKPVKPLLLKARIAACLEKEAFFERASTYRREIEEYNLTLEKHVREQVEEISSTQLATIFAMSKLAESRDPETGEHLDRMREYVRILALQMKEIPKYANIIDDVMVNSVYAASPLHDIGKVGIPDRILQKPGKLTEDEFAIMKKHSDIGALTLMAVLDLHPKNAFIKAGIEIAKTHHERWDGNGYPNGLAGEDIPLPGRIMALADVYDALTSKRCYKEAFSHEKSKSIIMEGKASQFDPDVVDAFIEAEQTFLHVRKTYPDSEKTLLA